MEQPSTLRRILFIGPSENGIAILREADRERFLCREGLEQGERWQFVVVKV